MAYNYRIYPSLKGLSWPVVKRPTFSTLSEQAAGGQRYLTIQMPYPIYEFDVQYEYLLDADRLSLEAFYLNSYGGAVPFYWDCLNDDTVSAASPTGFGAGDGSTRTFSLVRAIGASNAFTMPVDGTFGSCVAYDNGTPAAATFDGNGNVTFTVAPAGGHALTWSGQYYYLVTFKDDNLELEQFMNLLHRQKGFTLKQYL